MNTLQHKLETKAKTALANDIETLRLTINEMLGKTDGRCHCELVVLRDKLCYELKKNAEAKYIESTVEAFMESVEHCKRQLDTL